MDDDMETRRVLQDAAVVRRSRRRIAAAIADLAARPLDEAVATRMRQALGRDHELARHALDRLHRVAGAATCQGDSPS
jgi:hypothetical protein